MSEAKEYKKKGKKEIRSNIVDSIVIKQKKLQSKEFIGFRSKKGDVRFGFAYKNGERFRVKSFENGYWENRTTPTGGYIIKFDVEKTRKRFDAENWKDSDFPIFPFNEEFKGENKELFELLSNTIDILLDVAESKVEVGIPRHLKSGTFIAFQSKRGKNFVGWAYRNGSNIRVKCFIDDEWKKKTVPAGMAIVVFSSVKRINKSIYEEFCEKDFPLWSYDSADESLSDILMEVILETAGDWLNEWE